MVTTEMRNKVLRYFVEHATDSGISFDTNKLAKRHSMGNVQMTEILKDLVRQGMVNTHNIGDTYGTRLTITTEGYAFHAAGGYPLAVELAG